MQWPDDVAAGLPAPDPDEPAGLRQNIRDELADHLACAVRREAVDSDDDDDVQHRVLERFGNPVQIARRLWIDAMKGKLMLQKLTVGFAALSACAAIAACVLLYSAVESTKGALDAAVEESRRDRVASEKASAALLAKLSTMSEESRKNSYRSAEWNPVRFKLVLGKDGTKPAVGYEVSLRGRPYRVGAKPIQNRGGSLPRVHRKSDARGIVDFGLVRPGEYSVTIQTPWEFSFSRQILVTPGSETEFTVACPERIVGATVHLKASLPDDLVKQDCAVIVFLERPMQRVGRESWGDASIIPRAYLSYRDKPTMPLSDRMEMIDAEQAAKASEGESHIAVFHLYGPLERQAKRWLTVEQRIERLMIIDLKRVVESDDRFKVPVLSMVTYSKFDATHVRFSPDRPTFTPRAGKENTWKITLPRKMIENARAALKDLEDQRKRNKEATVEPPFPIERKPIEPGKDKPKKPSPGGMLSPRSGVSMRWRK